jgi:hypothetical protein
MGCNDFPGEEYPRFELVEPASPTTPQLLACTFCGALVTGKRLIDRHETWHETLWKQLYELRRP